MKGHSTLSVVAEKYAMTGIPPVGLNNLSLIDEEEEPIIDTQTEFSLGRPTIEQFFKKANVALVCVTLTEVSASNQNSRCQNSFSKEMFVI